MTADRRHVRVAAGVVTPLLIAATIALPYVPAQAHGATSEPVSRAVACAPDGGRSARSAACRAAVAANGGRDFADWDNVRVANVRGQDRQRIPDGRLCSGGLDDFRGLDLARADWPATTVSPGDRFTFRYRQRIPHQGTFRLYVTKNGYDPTQPLRWSDIATRPFLTAEDPTLRGAEYVMSGQFPQGRAGRHVVFAIWQNTDTPDTYYSCSDVVFAGAGRTRLPTPAGSAAESPTAGPAAAVPDRAVGGAGALGAATAGGGGPGPLTLAGGGLAAVALAAGAVLWRRRRL